MRLSRIHMCTTSRSVVVRIFLRADALGFRVHAGVNEEMTHFVSVISKVYRVPEIHELVGFVYWFAGSLE